MNKKNILDLTNYSCPLIYVKTKIFLSKTNSNEEREILIKNKKDFDSLKNTLLNQGFNVDVKVDDKKSKIILKKNSN